MSSQDEAHGEVTEQTAQRDQSAGGAPARPEALIETSSRSSRLSPQNNSTGPATPPRISVASLMRQICTWQVFTTIYQAKRTFSS